MERIREPIPPPEGVGSDLIQQLTDPRYECRFLQRMPLQTPHPAIVSYVAELLQRAPLKGHCRLMLDASGVGRPVADLFAALEPVGS